MSTPPLAGTWARKSAAVFVSALSFLVFLFLDFLDAIFCIIYGYLDEFFEGKWSVCCCENRGKQEEDVGYNEDSVELSDTLYRRKNVFRQMGFLGFARKLENYKKSSCDGGGRPIGNNSKWSDCGCESCVFYGAGENLHLVLKEDTNKECSEDSVENVICLHGFLSSSSLWTETVFPNLSEAARHKYRLFGVDLLGFGRSPKPRNCFYTIKDHLEMVEKSVINPYGLKSFHLVAHSMGCIVALALAAKYSNSVKSITLIAPPYFPSSKEDASITALEKLAGKTLWPPLLFGSAFMSWYEHLGRCVCLIICRNHRLWERILKLITWKRDLHFVIVDLTRHTHHSAWNTMHNVICGGAKFMDDYLETLIKSRVKICVIQGDRDDVVPLECSSNIKDKVPAAEVSIISNAGHGSVILGREKDFTQSLEHIWASVADKETSLGHSFA